MYALRVRLVARLLKIDLPRSIRVRLKEELRHPLLWAVGDPEHRHCGLELGERDAAGLVVDHAAAHGDGEAERGVVDARALQPAQPAVRQRQVDRALRRVGDFGE